MEMKIFWLRIPPPTGQISGARPTHAMSFPSLENSPAALPWRPASLALAALLVATSVAGQARSDPADYAQLKGMNLEELLQVQVSSVSGFNEKLKDAPSAIQVVSGEDISRAAALTLADALRLANNLQVASKNPHDWAIGARGFNANVGNKLLVLMDGRSVYTPLFAGVFWSSQDYLLEDIDQIEVISGPGGTIFGANAVNGVINIHSRSAADTQGWLFKVGAGNETEGLAAIRYGGKLSHDVSFRVYGKAFSHDAGVLADGTKAHDRWDQAQAGFRVDANLSATDTATVQGDLYSGDLDLQTGNAARISGGNLLGRWTRKSGGDAETKVQVYYDRTSLVDAFPASNFAPAGVLRDTLDTLDFQFQRTQRFGEKQRLTGGVGYRFTHDHVKQQAPNVAFLPARLDQDLPSAFLQDEIHLRPDLALTLGSKFEHNDYTGYEYEPNLRLQWKPVDAATWWLAVSRAVRMPSRFDRDLFEPAPPNSLLAGNSSFRSEIVIAYEGGYRRTWNSRLSTSLALFYNEYDRLRSWGITPVTVLPVTYKNDLEATSYGAELNVDLQLTPSWRLNAGYNYLAEDVRLKPGGFDLENALDETADPKHQASLRSYLNLPHGWQLDAALRWVDMLHNNNGGAPGTVPAYTELDLHAAWQFAPHLELALIGRNLLHAHHPEYGPPSPQREQLQREVFAKVAWKY